MTKLWQLHIDKEIVPDWTSDIFHSRLYHSHEACMDGCLTDELFEIGKVLWERGNFTEAVGNMECDDAEELKNRYDAGDQEVVAYMESVRQWLRRLSNKGFYGDWSMVWNMLKFDLVSETSSIPHEKTE